MYRRRFLERAGVAGIAAGASLSLAGCLADQYDVGMTATEFRPAEVTVEVGDAVTWENTSVRGHTVTAYEDAIPEEAEYFASGGFGNEAAAREAWSDFGGRLENGDRFSHTFSVPGRYDYVCLPHETGGMVGAVIVEE